MVVVRENAALAPHDAVQRLGDAETQSLHAARECRLVVRLDHEVVERSRANPK